MTSRRRATITGTGLFVPEHAVTNDFFSRYYKRDLDTFLREQRNIYKRHFMSAEQATSDLAVPAALEAMKNAGVTARDIDLVIVATDTPDQLSPSTASVVSHKLGLTRAGSFDVNSACAGFATALDMASKYIIADERYQTILVVGAYGMSKFFDWTDYKTTTIFADGAGAAIVQPSKNSTHGILAAQLTTDGQYHDHMGIYGGGTKHPINDATLDETLRERRHLLQFTKRIPPETNSREWPLLANAVLDRINARVSDVAHFFFTQINIGSIQDTMTTLGASLEKAHNIMDQYGYTGAASIPMAMADAARLHKLKKDDLVMILASGGGISMSAVALRWSYDT